MDNPLKRETDSIRMIAIDLIDEICAADPESEEHVDAQTDALMRLHIDDSITPEDIARVLLIAIADRLGPDPVAQIEIDPRKLHLPPGKR